jgi:large subunit ribosomal protein L7/L12
METKETKTELSKKMKDVMETIESMTVIELADLVKALEEKFGVQAQAAVSMQAVAGQAQTGQAPAAEEKSTFTVVLASAGANKIQVIKELRAVTSLGLKEAKDLVDGAPKTVKEGATKEEADKIKKQLEASGAKVELK